MLEIENLKVSIEEKLIINNLSLSIKPGEIHAIMGPNGSGKSTIAHALAGKMGYEVSAGNIMLNNKNLLDMSPTERSLEGLFLAFQYPTEIPGVTNATYLRQIMNSHRSHKGDSPIEAGEFLKILKEKSKQLGISNDMHTRFVNTGFSGGEKKKNEVLQMDLLSPKLIIMDETDSGLDVDALKLAAEAVNRLKSSKNSFIIITHYLRLLEYIVPDHVHIFKDGNIVESGNKNLADHIDQKGYVK